MRATMVGAPVTMAVLGVAAAALLWSAVQGASLASLWRSIVRAADMVGAAAGAVVGSLPEPITTVLGGFFTFVPRTIAPWLLERFDDPRTVLLLFAVAAVVIGARSAARVSRMSVATSRLRTARKWAAGYGWNVLWLVWALPLIIAVAVSMTAAVSWLLFYLPWRAYARIRLSDMVQPAHYASEPRRTDSLQPR
jgi:hypothetical protein